MKKTKKGCTITNISSITANTNFISSNPNIIVGGTGALTYSEHSTSTAVTDALINKNNKFSCCLDKYKLKVKIVNKFPDYKGKKTIQLCYDSVYILFRNSDIVYIGESINPFSRIGAHTKDKQFDGFRILPTSRRKYWEKVLIRKYKPLYNTHGV